MVAFKFNLNQRSVERISTKNRVIKTKIPTRNTLKVLKKLKNYEGVNALEQLPVVWDKAIESFIIDKDGNKWIDFTSSIFVSNSGHGDKNIIKNINKIISKPLLHSYYYPTEIKKKFLEKLIKITPKNLNKAILLSAGTEATERAIKISKIFGQNNKIKKNLIIGWSGNYHGKTLNAQMISGQPKDHNWIENFDKNIIHLPFPFPWLMKKNLDGKTLFKQHILSLKKKYDVKSISAFFVESFQGWGAIFYPKSYIQELRKFCNQNKSLLVFDEIQAGFYRTGKLFGYQNYGVKADLVICGKGISGSLPLSAVLGESRFINLDSNYTSTHGGHPVCCAAALGNLETLSSQKILKNIKKCEVIFKTRFKKWKKMFKQVKYTLGKGMIHGVFIYKDNGIELDEYLTNIICEKAMEKGVFSICTGRGTLKLGPPVSIDPTVLIEGLDVYEDCMMEVLNR